MPSYQRDFDMLTIALKSFGIFYFASMAFTE